MTAGSCSVIIPAYNEVGKIEGVLQRMPAAWLASTIVVDDGSTDATPEVIRRSGARLLFTGGRRGVGCALRVGIEASLADGIEAVVIMAGNSKDDPAEISKVAAPVLEGRADFVQGSRYRQVQSYGDMPAYRLIATRLVHPLLWLLATGRRLTDTTNGFRCIHRRLFHHPSVRWREPWLERYEFEYYLLYQAVRLGLRVVEVPVRKVYPPKRMGYTKVAPFRGWWNILEPLLLLSAGLRR